MYSFKNDYSEGVHPRILEALSGTNFEQYDGYGEDIYTKKTVELLKDKIQRKDVDIHLLSGGTQTNLITISAFLKPYEAVISANTGHILVHETGAIEATGHKIISVDVKDGKLTSNHIEYILNLHNDEHMVKPKLVYISNSTEVGSIYKKREIEELSICCKKNNLILFMDGARLGSALCSSENDLKLSDLAKLVDSFYIGGTKNGALLGEALVICKDSLKKDFRFNIKQKGGLLAKGRVLGIQFYELFKDDLYFELAKHANNMANLLDKEMKSMNLKFLINSSSNQLFPIISNKIIKKLQKEFSFYIWERINEDYSAIRLVTSWATKEEKVIEFIELLKKLNKNM